MITFEQQRMTNRRAIPKEYSFCVNALYGEPAQEQGGIILQASGQNGPAGSFASPSPLEVVDSFLTLPPWLV